MALYLAHSRTCGQIVSGKLGLGWAVDRRFDDGRRCLLDPTNPAANSTDTAAGRGGATRELEYDAAIYRDNEARFWLDLTQPDVGTIHTTDGHTIVYHPDGSWARLHNGHVTQGGPRNLWDHIETSHRTWIQAGKPARQRYGLTITPGQQTIWLDHPDQPVHHLTTP
jgi:hypothetical protein